MTMLYRTEEITSMNLLAVNGHKNRCLTDEAINLLDPDGIHVEVFRMDHNDREIRIGVLLKFIDDTEPHHAWIDVDYDAIINFGIDHTEFQGGN